MTKQDYVDYLKKYKQDNYPTAPVSAEKSAEDWIELMNEDLDEFVAAGGEGFIMSFYPNKKKGPILHLTENGELPEKYAKKFEGYRALAKERGIELYITEIIRESHRDYIFCTQQYS